MTATDIDLDTLLDALAARARSRAASTRWSTPPATSSPYASTGRITVNPGDLIASAWGNTTYDQTVQAYDNAGARDSQWPTPKDSAVAYTADTQTVWVRRAGTWRGLPLGWIAQTVGPASAVNVAQNTTIITLAAPVVAGRRYRLSAARPARSRPRPARIPISTWAARTTTPKAASTKYRARPGWPWAATRPPPACGPTRRPARPPKRGRCPVL